MSKPRCHYVSDIGKLRTMVDRYQQICFSTTVPYLMSPLQPGLIIWASQRFRLFKKILIVLLRALLLAPYYYYYFFFAVECGVYLAPSKHLSERT